MLIERDIHKDKIDLFVGIERYVSDVVIDKGKKYFIH